MRLLFHPELLQMLVFTPSKCSIYEISGVSRFCFVLLKNISDLNQTCSCVVWCVEKNPEVVEYVSASFSCCFPTAAYAVIIFWHQCTLNLLIDSVFCSNAACLAASARPIAVDAGVRHPNASTHVERSAEYSADYWRKTAVPPAKVPAVQVADYEGVFWTGYADAFAFRVGVGAVEEVVWLTYKGDSYIFFAKTDWRITARLIRSPRWSVLVVTVVRLQLIVV